MLKSDEMVLTSLHCRFTSLQKETEKTGLEKQPKIVRNLMFTG
jgi:hypothetical protein